MSGYTVYALRVSDDRSDAILRDLQKGEGRFGWSYAKTADLRKLKRKRAKGQELTDEEKHCAQWFLLDLEEGDYVIYINVPEFGKCTLARIVGPYVWRWEEDDFNHRFPVDGRSVVTFDRNDEVVNPRLSSRLKFQGRYWRVVSRDDSKEEFEELLGKVAHGGASGKLRSSNVPYAARALRPLLRQITAEIHRMHPRKDLEVLCAALFRKMPDVRQVDHRGHGRRDKGADLIVTFGSGIPGLVLDRKLLVQVKAFGGEHSETGAVEDLRRAFEHHPEADFGLIISTAERKTKPLEEALEGLREEVGKPVELLIGEDVARLFLQYGGDLLGLHLDAAEDG